MTTANDDGRVVGKEDILSAIKAYAASHDRIGKAAFLKETGISGYLINKHWGGGGWNKAVKEAGLPTKVFARPRTGVEQILECVSQLILALNKWPAQTDLIHARASSATFPDPSVVLRYMKDGSLAAKLIEYCSGKMELTTVLEIARQHVVPVVTDDGAKIKGHVYLMRTGRRYKIGRTNDPVRRHREVSLLLPDPTTVVHTIKTDDPPGIEVYWLERFKEKRVRDTEFFDLDAKDVRAFKRRTYQ